MTIKTAKITDRLFFGKSKDNKASFGSDKSFESFGSMDENQPIVIMNPNEYTVENDDPKDDCEIIEEEKANESIVDFEMQQDVNLQI